MKIAIALALFAGLAGPAAPALAAGAPGTPAVSPTPTATAFAAGRPQTGAATAAAAPAPTGVAAPATAATAQPATSASPAAGPSSVVLVARYGFDGGADGGHVADTSGRGPVLTIRSADQGVIRFESAPEGGRYIAFPDLCPAAATCPRALLEAADDADLNPGTRLFHWSARVRVLKTQVKGSANIMQKGVATTGSQWKMQIGATQGRAQCVVVGVGSAKAYLARSAATVADGLWHKIFCERSGSTLSVYVDGVVKGTTAIPATLSISNTRPMRIGGANFNAHSDMYHGLLDDVYAELG